MKQAMVKAALFLFLLCAFLLSFRSLVTFPGEGCGLITESTSMFSILELAQSFQKYLKCEKFDLLGILLMTSPGHWQLQNVNPSALISWVPIRKGSYWEHGLIFNRNQDLVGLSCTQKTDGFANHIWRPFLWKITVNFRIVSIMKQLWVWAIQASQLILVPAGLVGHEKSIYL